MPVAGGSDSPPRRRARIPVRRSAAHATVLFIYLYIRGIFNHHHHHHHLFLNTVRRSAARATVFKKYKKCDDDDDDDDDDY
jgi:hypothetical protein